MQLLEALSIIEQCAPDITIQYDGDDFKLSPKGQVQVTICPTMEVVNLFWSIDMDTDTFKIMLIGSCC